MPTTLPGYLLLLGTALIVASFLEGEVSLEKVKLPRISHGGRVMLRIIGVLFLMVCAGIYLNYFEKTKTAELPVVDNDKIEASFQGRTVSVDH